MINSTALLPDLQRQVTTLEDDLRARCEAEPSVDAPLKARYDEARVRARTALTYKAWREEELTNVAVAWILACVFVRFLEDNGLVDTCYLAGPDAEGLGRARDQHELFFREHPLSTERDYLEHVFTATSALPAMAEFFDRRHNPLWSVGPTGDAAAAALNFWRRADPVSGRPLHDFSDPEWSTRFLGDLYQDLSAAARKRYALLQTPVFVEQFILDRTLTPAIETFGFKVVRMIDPTCGSGHFCLGGFARLHKLWVEAEPAESPSVLAQRALDQVFGVDLNPNVVAIARFRLLLAALRVTGTTQLRHAFNFRINVATGDSLLHGRRFRDFESNTGPQRTFDTEEIFRDELKHHYEVEDVEALHRILGQQYHAVVGNPPYIAVKDSALKAAYKNRYPSCAGKWVLVVPFIERFFDLTISGDGTVSHPAGFMGQITGNNFMKREFGKKLIEEYLPRWDLTHVLDTDKAHIPGHATGTVILFGKNQPPVAATIRAVVGIKKQEPKPEIPDQGLVWRAITSQVDRVGSQSEWISVADSPRDSFHHHPWSIGGGGASELKSQIEEVGETTVGMFVDQLRGKPNIGITAFTLEDDAYVQPELVLKRQRLPAELRRDMVEGDSLRDWTMNENDAVVWPYTSKFDPILFDSSNSALRFLWPARTCLTNNVMFGQQTKVASGLVWYEFGRLTAHKLKTPLSITFGEIATNNHFVLDRGGKVFKNSAQVIKLKAGAVEEDHKRLLGLLNSSTVCFFLKQICHDKGAGGIGGGIAAEEWEHRFTFNATPIASVPIPADLPIQLPTALVQTSTALQAQSPAATLARWTGPESGELRTRLATARDQATRLRRQLIAWQEELDWQIYEAFGLVPGAAASDPAAVSLPEGEAMDRAAEFGLELGERAFEIVLARRMAAGEVQTTWFERHGSTPLTELPRHWPAAYRELVERRLRRIADDPAIRLIEQREYKRRWNTEPWDKQFTKAARDWLLARLEGYFFEGDRVLKPDAESARAAGTFAPATRPAFTTTNQLAEIAKTDDAFQAVAEQLMGGPGFSVPKLVRELVESASVPALPAQRYKPSGLLKRHDWEQVWELQRREDAIDAAEKVNAADINDAERAARKAKAASRKKSELGEIPVPPKFKDKDFKKDFWWSLRGKLDVPKERWVSFPGAERTEDPSPVIAWAGWDHAQQARALAEYYLEAKQTYAFPTEKLKPLLAGLLELEPWLVQWHSAVDPLIGDSPANAIRGFVDAEVHALGTTREDLKRVRMGA
jgi:hypothetical protein